MNKVTNWKYQKPTKEGAYLICFGDVETVANMRFVQVFDVEGMLFVGEQDGGNVPLDEYSDSWKWAGLCFTEHCELAEDPTLEE